MCAALYMITVKELWQLDIIFFISFLLEGRKKQGNVSFTCQLSLPT